MLIPKDSEENKVEEKATEGQAVEEHSKDEASEVHVETKVQAATTTDDQLTKDFFNGDYCLQGVRKFLDLPFLLAFNPDIFHAFFGIIPFCCMIYRQHTMNIV